MECLKCKHEMITSNLAVFVHGGSSIYLSNKKKGILEPEQRSTVSCYVCPECGYIELNADNPKELILE